jgi:hypothetical protein
MSRRKKKARSAPLPRPPDDRATLIRQRAAIYRCPNSLSDDFRGGCEALRRDLAIEIDFIRVALKIWSGHAGRAAALSAILTDLLDAHRRHDAALAALRDRFEAFCFEEATPHEHLDPIEPIQDLLRAWVFYDPPQD